MPSTVVRICKKDYLFLQIHAWRYKLILSLFCMHIFLLSMLYIVSDQRSSLYFIFYLSFFNFPFLRTICRITGTTKRNTLLSDQIFQAGWEEIECLLCSLFQSHRNLSSLFHVQFFPSYPSQWIEFTQKCQNITNQCDTIWHEHACWAQTRVFI